MSSKCKSAEEIRRTRAADGCGEMAAAGRGNSPFSDTSEGAAAAEPQLVPEPAKKIPRKELNKAKRREDKTLEQVLRALSSLESTEEKLAALCKKYTDLLEEHRTMQSGFKQSQKSLTTIIKEKDHLQSEHSKAVLAKSKLESLCRELQRHNKLIKEESLGRAKEEEEKRKEVTNKFQTTINDIQSQMNDHYQKNGKLREENMELANKLKSLIEQYETREQHVEKIMAHKDLEKQLWEAKLAQSNLMMQEEKETHLTERQVLLTEATEAHKRLLLMEQSEVQLREQVKLYTEKYEDFQSTLTKSNDVFQSFKLEMDKSRQWQTSGTLTTGQMTKKIKKLEKETVMWRNRWETSNKTLLDMAEDKTRAVKEAAQQDVKIRKLESLCRVMQEQRRQATAAALGKEEETARKEVTAEETPNSETLHDPTTISEAVTTNGGSVDVGAKPQETTKLPSKNGTLEKSVRPTSTPPNTPDEGNQSRASPVTTVEEETTAAEPFGEGMLEVVVEPSYFSSPAFKTSTTQFAEVARETVVVMEEEEDTSAPAAETSTAQSSSSNVEETADTTSEAAAAAVVETTT